MTMTFRNRLITVAVALAACGRVIRLARNCIQDKPDTNGFRLTSRGGNAGLRCLPGAGILADRATAFP